MEKNVKKCMYICLSICGFPGGAVVKNLPASAWDARDVGCILGSGRSLGVENGNLLYLVFLPGKFHDWGVWWATVHEVAKKLDMTEHTHTYTCITESLCCTTEINTTL